MMNASIDEPNGDTHITQADGSIFDDLGYPPERSEVLKVKAALMTAIHQTIDDRGLTEEDAANRFGVPQARIAELRRGKISLFTTEQLVAMLAHAGMQVEVNVQAAA
ncbi:MAG TPA: helix-turn-helix transcriptional regulator [Longimicrobium sp.]|nr:helix-turn-helix transcriptional regulator [Longimicrobium sp.]